MTTPPLPSDFLKHPAQLRALVDLAAPHAQQEPFAVPPALNDTGYIVIAGCEVPETCAQMVRAIATLRAAGLPAVVLYAFDAPWRLGERVRAAISAGLDQTYVLLDDAWAWQIERGTEGWPPHRGFREPLTRKAPEIINVWVALSDAPENRSCMHIVPLDEDPNIPDALEANDVPDGRARALPVEAGTALAWNANALHWGGACSLHADGPRVSCSFTLARSPFAERFRRAPSSTAATLEARLDSIAQQIETYGDGQADVSDDVRQWARATCALRAQIEHLAKLQPARKPP